jgi:hypothetical protein
MEGEICAGGGYLLGTAFPFNSAPHAVSTNQP